MSQSVKCPVDISLRDILKCRLPDHDMTKKVETELLQKWEFSEAFVKLLDERRNQIQQTAGENDNRELAKNVLNVDVKSEVVMNCPKEHECILKTIPENQFPKMNDSVRELYDKATACYRCGQFQDSLVYISKAGESSDSPDQIMLLAFKAKVLNAMGDYIGTLRSIEKASHRVSSGEFLLEGAKALEKLDLLLTAEEWLKKMMHIRSEDTDRSTWTQTIQELFQDVRLRRIYEPLIKNAPIKMSMSETGRAVYAKDGIAKGEVIFSELPEFLEQSLASQSVAACSQCGATLLKPDDVMAKDKRVPPDVRKAVKKCWQTRATIACPGCNRVLYCSESCRQDAWLSHHKDVCPSSQNSPSTVLYDVRDSFRDVTTAGGFSWQGWWNAEFSPLLLARVWASALIQAKLRAGDKTSSTSDDFLMAAFSNIKKYSVNCATSVSTCVPRMFDLMKHIFKRSKFLGYEITEAEFDAMYHRISTNYISFHDVSNPIQELLDRENTNQKLYKKIVKFVQDPVQKVELHGLFPLASCINHCCLPNAEVLSGIVGGRPGIVITATRDIPAMEEVTIAYIDPRLSRRHRQDILFRRYRFWCKCPRCQFEGDGPDTCTHCGKHPQGCAYNRTSELNQDSFAYLQNYSVIQHVNGMHSFTGSLESSKLKNEELFGINYNCREDNQKDPREADHFGDLKSVTENEDHYTCCVTDVCGSDFQENCSVDNESNRKDLPREGAEKGPNVQTEEIRTEPENTGSSQSVIADEKNVRSASGYEREGLTKYPHCGRCGRAWYCSEKCQKEAWKRGHKQICRKL